jgi:hypothetical protein
MDRFFSDAMYAMYRRGEVLIPAKYQGWRKLRDSEKLLNQLLRDQKAGLNMDGGRGG